MQIVNIGILAHVDAGKTSLTERLLFDTGVIGQLGSVDAGTTQTDTNEIERRRGITIRSAVASFVTGGRRVNLIDTPGHSDFIAEVERALGVLDGAIVVLSAVEGVQPHTRVLMKILRKLGLPSLIFINKIDRRGARGDDVLADIARLLTPAITPMGTVRDIGTPGANFRGYDHAGADFTTTTATVLADHDDVLLRDLVDGGPPDPDRVGQALCEQVAAGLVHPVFFGSALSGAGIADLLDAVGRLLPPAPAAEARLRGRVFAIERGPAGEKLAYLRSYGGELRDRQRVTGYRRGSDGTLESYRAQVTGLHVVGASTPQLSAGQIGAVRGLGEVRIGDQIGSPDGLDGRAHFMPPSLSTVVRPRDPGQTGALHAALQRLADQDPLIHTHVTADGESTVLLYGEVQKEVLATTLADVYGVEAVFSPSQLLHLERPVGVGSVVEYMSSRFYATIGLRVEPGNGFSYRLEVELGALLLAFHKAIEETVRAGLDQGVYGWPVNDITVTLTHCGYNSIMSTAGDFRRLTPLVLARALAVARTRVYEPCHRFEVEVPLHRLGQVTAALANLGARLDTTTGGVTSWLVTGELPARAVPGFQRQLPGLASGEGLWTSRPAGDRMLVGTPPRRRRTDGNPFDRDEYLRFLAQRLPTSAG